MSEASLEETLTAFLKAGLELLAQHNQTVPVLAVKEERVDFSRLGASRTHFVEIPMFLAYVSSAKSEVDLLPATASAASALLRHPSFELPRIVDNDQKDLQPTEEQLQRHAREKLSLLLASYPERYGGFGFSAESLNEHVSRFCSVWVSREVSRRVIIPLISFVSAVDEFAISDTIRIIRFTPEAKSRLWKASLLGSPPIDVHLYGSCEFALVSYYTSPSPISAASAPALPNAERAILALRLQKADDVYPGLYFDEVVPPEFCPGAGGGRPSEWSPVPSGPRATYRVDSIDDVIRIQELYKVLDELDRDGRLGNLYVAIRRFTQTHTREYDEDKLVDLTIALENTLLFGSRDELQYRLALRGATLSWILRYSPGCASSG